MIRNGLLGLFLIFKPLGTLFFFVLAYHNIKEEPEPFFKISLEPVPVISVSLPFFICNRSRGKSGRHRTPGSAKSVNFNGIF